MEEARRVLTPFGALQQTFTISKSDMEIFNLPEGIWVKFAFFQDCRDAQIVSRVLSEYASSSLTSMLGIQKQCPVPCGGPPSC